MRKIFSLLILGALSFFSFSQTLVNPNDSMITTPPPPQINMLTCGLLNTQTYIDCNVVHDFVPFIASYSFFLLTLGSSMLVSKFVKTEYFNHYENICDLIQLTRGTIFLCSFYFAWWIAMLTYSFMTDDNGEVLFRLGVWISLNMATVLLPITRNSIWIVLFKISYIRILNIHKFMAILCIISIIIKLVLVLIYFNFNFLFIHYNPNTAGSPLAGTLSSLAMILIGVLAIPVIRRNLFELFYFSHRFLFLFSIATGIWHYILTLYYIIPTFFLYIVDICFRYLNTKKALYSHLKIIGNEDQNTSCVLMTISLLKNVETPPGSYFFLCFRDVSSIEWHPFSLITQNHNNLTFCVKDMGKNSWVHKLKVLDMKKTLHSRLKDSVVLLQGPYGHINIDYKSEKYKYLILVAGGIGITPILSILHDINNNISLYKHIKHVFVIWVTSHGSLVNGLNFLLVPLNKRLFSLNIYSTCKNIALEEKNDYFPIKNGRPKVGELITDIFMENQIINTEIGVSCCGPPSLSKDVIITCAKNNIDICNENF